VADLARTKDATYAHSASQRTAQRGRWRIRVAGRLAACLTSLYRAFSDTASKAMPFDGVGFAFPDRVSKIDQVIDLLASPDKWCQGNYKTPDGRFCIRGAIAAVEGANCLRPIVLQAIREVTGKHYFRIESFNDHADTNHAQVVQVLMRAHTYLISAQLDTKHGGMITWRARVRALLRRSAARETVWRNCRLRQSRYSVG